MFSGPRLCLKTARPSEMVTDQVTALAATSDNRLIAVAMVNLHVDVFFSDSFKVSASCPGKIILIGTI